MSFQFNGIDKMFLQTNVKFRNNHMSFMYPEILRGHGVLNCYQPINRELNFQDEFRLKYTGSIPFVVHETQKIPSSCIEESHFTQGSVNVSTKCPSGTCLLMNHLTNKDKLNFKKNLKNNLYCTK
jgi:hypothetical protein